LLETLSPRFRTKARYSEDGQYEGEAVVSFDPAGLNGDDLEKLRTEVEKALRPMHRDEIIQQISLLRAVTKARAEEGSDKEAMLRVYAVDLGDLPGPALKRAILEIRKTATWFPTIAEIREKTELKAQRARAIHSALNHTSVKALENFPVKRMDNPEARFAAILEKSKNWPDPMVKRTVEVKPIHVFNPETARLIEAARLVDSLKVQTAEAGG
jgi:hypothetical protein